MNEQKNIAILGLGKSGKASAQYFKKLGYKVHIHDDNIKNLEDFNSSDYIAEGYENWPYKKLEAVVFSPGIPHNLPEPHAAATLARKHNVDIICDVEVLANNKPKGSKIIAITGTNGKSTTTALIHHILCECGVEAEIGGNYGIPALELDLKTEGKIYVIEVSSFQLDLCKKAVFDSSILLNITPDHMERYVTIDKYGLAKRRIFEGQQADCTSIICTDQEITLNIAKWAEANLKSKKQFYNTKEFNLNTSSFNTLQGEHNKQNIIAAMLAVNSVGLNDDNKIFAAIESFKGLKHRANIVYENERIKFINDSKATNAEAAKPSLKTFENIYWLAGGIAKQGGIDILSEHFSRVKKAFFYGKAKDNFAKTYSEAGFLNFEIFDNFEQAVQATILNTKNDDKIEGQNCVLLSPACASFDEFNSFEQRGDRFEEIVKQSL